MADGYMRKVGLDFQVEGVDQAARKTDDLAEKTRGVGQATDEVRESSGRATDAVVKDTGRQAESWNDVRQEADEYGGTLAALGGAAALGAVTSGLDSVSAASGRMRTQLGLSNEEAERAGEIARRVYANNFTDSLEEATDVVSQVKQSFRDLADEDVQHLAESFVGIEDAFGHLGADAQIIAEDVRAITANMPGTTEAEAIDLIVDSFQSGTGAAGDLQDTLQEYPGDFARVGLDAEDMFGILNAGMEAGIRNTDLVADGVREMAIRMTDDASGAADALAAMFPPSEAERLRSDFASGGEAGRDAYFDIMEGLNQIEDPLRRNNLAIEIMGTRYEDVAGQMPAFMDGLASVEQGTGTAAGAAETLGDQYDHAGSKFQSFLRTMQTGALGSIGDFAGGAAEVATSVGTAALGVQGLGIDVGDLKSKVGKFKWGPLAKGGLIAAGLAAVPLVLNEITDLTDVDVDSGMLTQGLEQYIEVGTSAQLDSAIGNTEALGDHLREHFFADIKFGQAREMPALISELDSALSGMIDSGRVDDASTAFALFDESMTDAGVPVDLLIEEMPQFRDALAKAGLEVGDLTGEAEDLAPAAEHMSRGVERAEEALRGTMDAARPVPSAVNDITVEYRNLDEAAQTVDEAVADLDQRWRDSLDGTRDVRAATSDWEASLDDLTGSIDEHGTSLDLTTEKGRANEQAIHDAQQAAIDHAAAVFDETQSIDEANKVLDQHREDLVDVLVQSGMSKDAAREYADEIRDIPDDAETRAEFDKALANESINNYIDSIDDIPIERSTYGKFFGSYDEVAAWMRRLDDIQNATYTRGYFSPGEQEFHAGTSWFGGGRASINERGGELIDLPQGTAVTNSQASHDLLVGALREAVGEGGGQTIQLYTNPSDVDLFRITDALRHTP